jgi:hypothetical protein
VGFSAVKLHLSAFPKLRVLRVGALPCEEPRSNILVWLALSMREIASAVGDRVSNLEEIAVHLDYEPFEGDAAQVLQATWEVLDTLLASPPTLSNLRKFKVYLCTPPPFNVLLHEPSIENVKQLFCVWMPGLFKKGFPEVQPTLYWKDIVVGEGEAR